MIEGEKDYKEEELKMESSRDVETKKGGEIVNLSVKGLGLGEGTKEDSRIEMMYKQRRISKKFK